MKLEYSYKWYLATCKENNLNPKHELATFYLDKAKEQSRRMKYFMDALERYKDYEKAVTGIKKQIKYHNEQRIKYMLNALESAAGKGLELEE